MNSFLNIKLAYMDSDIVYWERIDTQMDSLLIAICEAASVW